MLKVCFHQTRFDLFEEVVCFAMTYHCNRIDKTRKGKAEFEVIWRDFNIQDDCADYNE